MKVQDLGHSAYVSWDEHGAIITGGDPDPEEAENEIYLDQWGVIALKNTLDEILAEWLVPLPKEEKE